MNFTFFWVYLVIDSCLDFFCSRLNYGCVLVRFNFLSSRAIATTMMIDKNEEVNKNNSKNKNEALNKNNLEQGLLNQNEKLN